jgi:hypothetical protein
VVLFATAEMRGVEMVAAFERAHLRIRRLVARAEAPFVIRLNASATAELLESGDLG